MDDDDDLAAIRARRMAELRGAGGGGGGPVGRLPAGLTPASAPGQEDQAEKRAQMEEMRRTMLVQLLDNQARERLARISMVKADKARSVEDMLIRMAQTGQLRGKVNEKMLIDLLEQISEQTQSQSKITIARRRVDDDDDDDDFGL
ncbi:PDCD5-related protein [Zopfochytrium polystomum]|nr:PDCD5-related protein [Zopfochytrium polystomum]